MDIFLGKVTQQAMNYAIRSGVSITASYAIRQSARLLKNAPQSNDRDELLALQQRIQTKIHIISPAIDMIELIAARGNTSLESAISLTKELRFEIQSLGQRLAAAAASEESAQGTKPSPRARAVNDAELRMIVADIKKLLERIEDAVPLINLAITTSGASLSTTLPSTVSPSRLLQASTFLTAGDTQYALSPQTAVQIGPTFTLSVYMLFAGHERPQNEEDIRETTWKEVMHKAKVKLRRVPMDVVISTGSGSDAIPPAEISSPFPESIARSSSHIPAEAGTDEFAYQIMIVEDLDDDRVHDFEDAAAQPGPFDDIRLAGIREMIPIHEISKIFYADTSKVLNIGTDAETNHPVLLLKRDVNAVPPRRMVEREQRDNEPNESSVAESQEKRGQGHVDREADPWRLPPSLDPEWIALEVYVEPERSDEESETGDESSLPVEDSKLADSMSKVHVNGPHTPSRRQHMNTQPAPWANAVRTSLSLFEMLLRLTSLQQFQQASHLAINDEYLNFFLEESAHTGAGGDEGHRQALRADARRRVGFDPYDESPLKRRGEEYQYYAATPSPRQGFGGTEANGASSPAGFQATPGTRVPDVHTFAVSDPVKDRSSWLRRQEQRKSSPLGPRSSDMDEGIGTSPGSVPEV